MMLVGVWEQATDPDGAEIVRFPRSNPGGALWG